MATTLPADSTQHARNGVQKAMAIDHVQRIGGLSRIVDRDIQILKMNVRLHDGRDSAWSSAWERLESASESVRTELADDSASSTMTVDVPPGNGAAAIADKVDAPMTVVSTVPLTLSPLNWVTGVLAPSFSSRTGQVVRWSREPARSAEVRAAALKVWRFASSTALTSAKHVSNGWCGLREVVRRQEASWESTWSRLKGKWQTWNAARSQSTEIKASAGAIEVQGDSDGVCGAAWEEGTQLRLESAIESAKAKLALIESASRPIIATNSMAQLDELATSSQEMPFVLHPLPWVLGALSPVISSRTITLHSSYHAQCIESANRLARDHKNLAGKNSLEIVRWACEHARGTELLSTASEAWNHSFTGSA